MIIKIGPSHELSRPPSATHAAPSTQESQPGLDFSRQLKFGGYSEIDEIGVALVDLSVLIYSPLDILHNVFSELGVEPVAFDAYCDRHPDFVWLERQSQARAIAKALGILPDPKRLMFTFSDCNADVARTRVLVDAAIVREVSPAGPEESPGLQSSRRELLSALDNYRVASPASDAEIAADLRNRPARVLAFRRDSNVYIAFRGSATRLDWKRNFMISPANGLPYVHKGFALCWQEVQSHLQNWLARCTRELGHKPTVHLGGHSLGGAIATLAAVDLAAAGYPVARVVTMGSPCVGGWGFRRRYRTTDAAPTVNGNRKLYEITTRFVHGTDAITLTPGLHVTSKQPLAAEDALNVEDFIGQGLFDTSALLALLGLPNMVPGNGYPQGLLNTAPAGKVKLLRNAITQILVWIGLYFPASIWVKMLPVLPVLFEHTRVSFDQHKSARYWIFLPPTVLRSVYSRVLQRSKTAANKVLPDWLAAAQNMQKQG